MSKKFNINTIVQERKNELDSSPLFQAPTPSAPMQKEGDRAILSDKDTPAVRKQIPSSHRSDQTEQNLNRSENPLPTTELPEKPEKYTTHLEPSIVKKLKLHATERDMKDYQVIKQALLLYFEKIEKVK